MSVRTLRKERNQDRFLEALSVDPRLSLSGACRLVGVSVKTMEAWRLQEGFASRLARVRAQRVLVAPPDPGDFLEWREKYVNLEVTNPYTGRVGHIGKTYPFMEPFVSWLNDKSKRFIGALLPVRHGKTTIIEHYAVYVLCKNPNARIVIVCGNQKHAKERAYAIQQILMDEELYPHLHAEWGRWIGKGDTWGLTEFRVRGRKDAQRSPSVSIYGITSKTYGARADLIILDDIDDPTNEATKREAILRSLQGSILNRIGEGGKVVAIGTRCGPDDVYSHLLDSPAWLWDVKSAINPDGTALCPELYSIEDIEQMRAVMNSEQEFQMVFLNNPVGIEGSLFPVDMVDAAKGNFGIGEAPEDWPRYIAVDPAPAGRAAVLTVAEDLESGEIRVIDLEVIVAGGYEGLIDAIRRQAHAHKPRMLIIEEQGGSFSISDNPHWRDVLTYELEGLTAYYFRTGGANKNDPSYGTALIRSLMGGGKLRIAWSPYDVDSQKMDQMRRVTQAKMRPLIDDLIGFQPVFTNRRRYDTVMALWFAVKVLTEKRLKGSRRRAPSISPVVRNRPWIMRRRSA